MAHHESKEVPVYNLVVAKGGPKFKPAKTVDVDELKRKYPRGGRVMGGGSLCRGRTGHSFTASPRAWLAQTALSSVASRPVVDKTGLTGHYDLHRRQGRRSQMRPLPDDESIGQVAR